ncbi:MAG: tRNA (adenosine(37)-N6)-threonylcarbamoyltransferase complex ATPase subunit type 1 TsaE [Woeseiaceae bacterium]|nr:tRNA (adenosine(37)-N6)-threonylcarbamoyltransferase complex ATPase subunit type 1 TsaE [Woeseiaceae bacterium]
MRQDLPEPESTDQFARRVSGALPANTAGWTLLLEGDLGSGKSTFARALIRALGHQGAVPSPTYTLIEPYDVSGRVIYHVDLYRVTEESELRYLGWTDLEDGLRLVEWPDRSPGLASRADLRLSLEYADPGRTATLEGLSDRGRALVTALENSPDTQSED